MTLSTPPAVLFHWCYRSVWPRNKTITISVRHAMKACCSNLLFGDISKSMSRCFRFHAHPRRYAGKKICKPTWAIPNASCLPRLEFRVRHRSGCDERSFTLRISPRSTNTNPIPDAGGVSKALGSPSRYCGSSFRSLLDSS